MALDFALFTNPARPCRIRVSHVTLGEARKNVKSESRTAVHLLAGPALFAAALAAMPGSRAAANGLQAGDILLILIGLHVAAIVFYVRFKKDNLVKPMITGWKDDAEGQSASGGGAVALVAALVIAFGAAWAASGSWVPPPPTAPATTAPAW